MTNSLLLLVAIEGPNTHRGWLGVICNERLAMFQDRMNKFPVCFLRSPRGSGKTTLAVLLLDWLRKKGCQAVHIHMQGVNASHNDCRNNWEAIKTYWKGNIGVSWSECFNPGKPMYIIVDEAHCLSFTRLASIIGREEDYWFLTPVSALAQSWVVYREHGGGRSYRCDRHTLSLLSPPPSAPSSPLRLTHPTTLPRPISRFLTGFSPHTSQLVTQTKP
ncbi:hypothetical protein AMATHDRAFT_50927 [Amanita thiersii Skay4041]|uniref:Uncharacterized protein n=1 Tax=Amanita thiersii Skay4041 TaxID=703135 RepID=A0A2A9N9C8_9AGAR|nr:hypothetical protein AMATHDRAFT_50927 [Amanita thiersii Skay4041]